MKRTAYFISILCLGMLMLYAFPLKAGMNDDFEKYIGKIVFSPDYISIENFNNNLLKDTFSLLDDLHMRVFMKETLENVYSSNDYPYDFYSSKYRYNYALRLLDNEQPVATWYFEMPPHDFSNTTTFSMTLSTTSEVEKEHNSIIVNQWADAVSGLEPGEHHLKLELVPLNIDIVDSEVPTIATGSFDLMINKENKKKFLEAHTTDIPPSTVINHAVEQMILDASNKIIPDAKPLRAFITDINEDWTYSADDIGNILYRHIIASVVYKMPDGTCQVESGVYSQKHEGYGEFGPMFFTKPVEGYFDYTIPCEKVIF